MKILSTTSLLFVLMFLFQSLASAWELTSFQVPLIISSWLGSNATPRVHQFLLDTGHPLDEIKACPRALAEARELTVDVYVHTGMGWQTLGDTWDTITAESTLPPKSLPALFFDVMGKMKNLSKIEWMVRGVDENAAIGRAFIEDGTRLPGVKHLVSTINAPWIVGACPSLTSLEAKRDDFVWGEAAHKRDVAWFAAAGRLKGLRKLDMGEVEWTGTMTDCVLRDTPHIEGLHIDLETTELDGKIVRQEFPGLHGVHVGGFCGNFTTGAEAEQVITWDWTGSMYEWLDEKQMAVNFTEEP
ncbi:hypothetical protein CLIM01_13054 [Colletotrichum limetticola]|uniref:Uncharacterized protein n=1 Tax=Colletotrichum limetticola TaxID=1209924 RepID=A0ABQ9PC02_9PEZI|nr:hypothetical protein CLIM01_13054 [Colletotrichum limetticola]